MKICVIGAGGAGLIAIKHSLSFNCEVIAFEQSEKVGGLWNFSDNTEFDKNGIEVHSSLYENLTTNLPIESMCYPDHPFKEQEKSYVPSDEVLRYYQDFAKQYDLERFIKFEYHVIRVRPLESLGHSQREKSWEVIVKDLRNNVYKTYIFDAIFICSGHFHSGFIPEFEGIDQFKGKQFHSSKYRRPEIFRDENVLIIGGNYSGFDLVQEASKFAKNVAWSHHLPVTPDDKFFKTNVKQKPDPKKFNENSVEFIDGSCEDYSMIVYCTGYNYSFPFLSVDCGINTQYNYVKPLWMHCVNIENPTMGFIGLNHVVCPNQLFDIQVRFFLTFLTGKKSWPSKNEMLKSLEDDLKWRQDKGMPKKYSHHLGGEVLAKYHQDLAEKAEISPIHRVIPKLHVQSLENRKQDYIGFHDYKFKIIDEENFEMWKISK
jgi:dimethylaniline monooxygenase (N-oxide forming)